MFLRSMDEERRLKALRRLNILDTPSEERFDRITRLAQRCLNAPYAILAFVDDDRVWFKSRQGIPQTSVPRLLSFCGVTILRKGVFQVPDALEDARFAENPLVTGPLKVRMYAGVPLRDAEDTAVGTLCVMDESPRTLTSGEKDTLRELGEWAIEEMGSYEMQEVIHLLSHEKEMLEKNQERFALVTRLLRRLALMDELTAIPNRRYFDQMLYKTFRHCTQKRSPLALLIVDVDLFKDYNDTYGHPAGDRCLQEIARRIRSCLMRPGDFVARYGGEEFAIVAPDTDEQGAWQLARRVCALFHQEPLPFTSVPEGAVTLSVGVAVTTGDRNETEESLLQRADAALYSAKRGGRNRICKWETHAGSPPANAATDRVRGEN